VRADEVTPERPRGVVAFDVDGVLLRTLFLWQIAQRRGPRVWIRAAWLGGLLKIGAIPVREAVERGYRLMEGTSVRRLDEIASSLKLAPGAADIARKLREVGYVVVLVSAGVPQRVVDRIAARVGADRASGIPLEIRDGRLTGRILGDRHSPAGKKEALESMLRALGFGWTDTTVVVDDRSNTEIVDAAWRSIGVNPELPILRSATFVLHTRNLEEILEFFPEGYRLGITPQWLAVRHEVVRKGIHACAVFVPMIASWSRPFALWLVGLVSLVFVVSELARLHGATFPFMASVTWRAMRPGESRGMAWGPILFGCGIWLALRLFPLYPATVGILILAIGDSAASVLGRAFGNTMLPHNPGKSLVGSVSLFAVGVIIAMFYVSFPWALLVGAVASTLESLPFGAMDNLFLPLATASVLAFARASGG
jgi:HAD superfamily phosphoserine phosphatase-like hydrolase